MKKEIFVLFTILFLSLSNSAFSQEYGTQNPNELVVSDTDLIIIFSGFIIAVIAIFLYLARHQILRKKLEYDKGDFESKKNRGGVYFSDTFVFKIRATVSELSLAPLLSQSMLGPNPDFQDLEITTKAKIDNSLKNVKLFAHLTNSMQSSSIIELNMNIIRIQYE